VVKKIIITERDKIPTPIKLPGTCPTCNSEIARQGKQLYCLNKSGCNISILETASKTKYNYQEEAGLFGTWKLSHLKLVSEYFDAHSFRKKKNSPDAMVHFNSSNQFADINYTLGAEKMPIKVASRPILNNSDPGISFSRSTLYEDNPRFYFDPARYNTNVQEVQKNIGLGYCDILEHSNGNLSFSYFEGGKHSIGYFFWMLGYYTKKPIKIFPKESVHFKKVTKSHNTWKYKIMPFVRLAIAIAIITLILTGLYSAM